jgi:hypothetical protein
MSVCPQAELISINVVCPVQTTVALVKATLLPIKESVTPVKAPGWGRKDLTRLGDSSVRICSHDGNRVVSSEKSRFSDVMLDQSRQRYSSPNSQSIQ